MNLKANCTRLIEQGVDVKKIAELINLAFNHNLFISTKRGNKLSKTF